MPFSLKAQQIYDYMVNGGKASDWIGLAKGYLKHKRQYEPGPPYTLDVRSIAEKLQTDLARSVDGANVGHWEEIAKWLFDEAKPGR